MSVRKNQETRETLQSIEKLIVKLRNKVKRSDLDYTVQISINSTDPQHITFAAQLTAPAKGLAPITFIADSSEELSEKIKLATKGIDYKAVELAYHQAQIEACKRTIQGHEDRIKEMDEEIEEEQAIDGGE